MNILILGSGGREHALAWKLAASPLTNRLYCAARQCRHRPRRPNASPWIITAIIRPLLRSVRPKRSTSSWWGRKSRWWPALSMISKPQGIKAFGPSRACGPARRLQGFHQGPLSRQQDPGRPPTNALPAAAPATEYVRRTGAPVVIKADGLAAGKGVVVATTIAEAEAAIDMMFGGALAEAGASVVVEEFLTGEEASFFVLWRWRQRGGRSPPPRTTSAHSIGDRGPKHRRYGRLLAGPGDDAGDRTARSR